MLSFFPSLSVTLATHYFSSVPLLPYFLRYPYSRPTALNLSFLKLPCLLISFVLSAHLPSTFPLVTSSTTEFLPKSLSSPQTSHLFLRSCPAVSWPPCLSFSFPFFFLLYPAPFILLPFASSPPPPIPPCLVSSVVHWLLIALWSWNATLTLSRPATESYWLEVWFKETTRDFFQGLLNLSSQLRLEYRLFTNLDKVWISCERSRKVTICLS